MIKYIFIPNYSNNFRKNVIQILNLSQSWGGVLGIKFKFSQNKNIIDYNIFLKSNDFIIDKFGDVFNNLSVAEKGGKNIYINSSNWNNTPILSKLSDKDYKIYVINHEMGHILGLDHPNISDRFDLMKCPVMVQQTLGKKLFHMEPNPFPLKEEINLVKKINNF